MSPLSAHNSLLPTAQSLPSLSTQHSMALRSIIPLSQHTTLYRPPLKFSPLSAHNTLSPTAQILPCLSTQHSIAHRLICHLSQHTTLYCPPPNYSPLSAHNTVSPTAQVLPSLSTKHSIAHRLICHPSQHQNSIAHCSLSPLTEHTTLYNPPINFSPLCKQNIIAHRSISPLSQHTTLYRPSLNFSPLSAHNTVYLHIAEMCVVLYTHLLQLVLHFACCCVDISPSKTSPLLPHLCTQQDTCFTDLP